MCRLELDACPTGCGRAAAAPPLTRTAVPVMFPGPEVTAPAAAAAPAGVDLYWIPLGAGDTTGCVRRNGRLFEWVAAKREHRPVTELYHSALEVHDGGARFVIEMTPAWGNAVPDRGVVAHGPVGLRPLGRSRLFRYEVRCWRDGVLPDRDDAVGGARCLSSDCGHARRLLDAVPRVPTLTWGRDEVGVGDMWNSNSLVAWLLVTAGVDTSLVRLPAGGQAPGWTAGLAAAREQHPLTLT